MKVFSNSWRMVYVLDIGAGGLDEVVHVGVSPEDFQAGSDLIKGWGGLRSPCSVFVIPCDDGQ